MKTSILAFSQKGYALAERINKVYSGEIYYKEKNGPLKDYMKSIWENSEAIIFIGATGIAIRYIAAYVGAKDRDPAVIVIDDCGKFVISLLSGHLGGANKVANNISKEIGARAVITTASDNRNIESIDMFAKENNYFIEDLHSITPVISAMVNGKKVGFFSEDKKVINYPNLEILSNTKEIPEYISGLILVTSSTEKINSKVPYTILRPKVINIGVGSKKGTKGEDLIELLENTFEKLKLSINSIKSIGTINIKEEEASIIQLSKYLNIKLSIFTASELSKVEHFYKGSEFVKKTVGVSSVSATSAHLLGGSMIAEKIQDKGFTLSICKEE